MSPILLQEIEESRLSCINFSNNYASSSGCADQLAEILECVEEEEEHTAPPVFHNVDPSNVKRQRGSFEQAFAKHEQVYGEKMEKVDKGSEDLTEGTTISEWDTRNSLSLPSSSSTHRWKYDVFLSFRGEDTRQSFTAHLYAALRQKGIITFKDNLLTRGEKISPALLQAIEESRFSIIIFSGNYASSSWCLDELTKILECVEEGEHTALPVFYNVDPSNVKKQKGSFEEAFAKHEEVHGEKMEKVGKWRKALTEAATISGWDTRNRDESKVIEEIVTWILNKQINAFSSNMGALVGMNSCMEGLLPLLCIGSNDVRFVGIWGMAGIGKTTIAKAIYDLINTKFEGCCFLENVREDSQRYGLTYLRETLLSQVLGGINDLNRGINFRKARLPSRKVLIVLDDVVHRQQLETLVGNRDYFGPGSRIVITSRDKDLLNRVDKIYAVEELAYHEAHKLFRWYAFEHNPITEDYMRLCNHVVDHIKGLPLSLVVLGSFLCNKNMDEWKSALDKLKRIPHEDVYTKLKISFDGLNHTQKEIFLDIACFFKGEDRSFVKEILDSDFFPIDIRVLINKSFITVSNNKLCMHDLLQKMGWAIVQQGDVRCPGNRSRLWDHDEVNDVLTTNAGTEAVEGIVFDLPVSEELDLSIGAFAKMSNLRLLRFFNFQFRGSFEYLSRNEIITSTHDAWRWRDYEMYNSLYNDSKVHLSRDFEFPSNNLRSLYWYGYPLKSLPSNFLPNKLIELNLCSSRLEQLWEGNKQSRKLKFIKLSHSQYLTKILNFSETPNLKRLILEGCTSLVEIDRSIGALKQLSFLNLKGCKKLKSFPSPIHMESLQILSFSGCSKLKNFPEVQGQMDDLSELYLDGTAIEGLPSSIEYLTGLTLLNLKECKSLESLPSSIFKLKSLKTLILSNCLRLKKLPEIQEKIESLIELFLDASAITELPSSIGRLNGLVLLNLKNCKKLASLPQSICELASLRTLFLCGCSELKELPDDLGSLKCLVELSADGTAILEVPPSINLLTNLQTLSLAGCKGGESKSWNLVLSFCSSPTLQPLRLPHLSGLYSLTTLNLSDCNLLEGALPIDLSPLSSLESLDLSRNSFIKIPASLSGLSWLKTLILMYCKSLQLLPELPPSIELLNAEDCTSLETFSCSSSACRSKWDGELRLEFSNCFGLMKNEHNDSVKHILQGIQLLASVPKFLGPDMSINGGDYPYNKYDAIVPGSRIPKWFVHRSTTSSVTVELHSNWYNARLMGMAVCAVVGAKGVIDPITEEYGPSIDFTYDGVLHPECIASLSPSMRADHMWFGYRSLARLTCVNGNPLGNNRGSMVISFRLGSWEEKLKVKKCGVRLVYEGEESDRGFPGGDESDSEAEELRQTCSPVTFLQTFSCC